MGKDADILRRAEDIVDPLAHARRVADGKWSPLDSPESARELLDTVEWLERAQQELRWAEQAVARDGRSAESRAAKHQARAIEIDRIRRKLASSMEGHLRSAADLVDGRLEQRLSDDEWSRFRRQVDRATDEQRLSRDLAELQTLHEDAAKSLRVVNEASVYGPDGEHSWFVDTAIAADRAAAGALGAMFGETSAAAAEQRLARYAKEIRSDLRKTGERAKQIRAIVRERARHEDEEISRRRATEEIRALTSGGGATASASGGGAASFVPPAFILDAWAPFRGIERTFADQCDQWPLPPYGMEAYVPVLSSTTATGQQNELAGVPEGDPSATLQAAQVQMITGQVTITQQLHDRGTAAVVGNAYTTSLV